MIFGAVLIKREDHHLLAINVLFETDEKVMQLLLILISNVRGYNLPIIDTFLNEIFMS